MTFIKNIKYLIMLWLVFFLVEKSNGGNFSLIVLPDTQKMMHYNPGHFIEQVRWIANQKDSLGIAYVAHVGDIVEQSWSIEQWEAADSGFIILEDINTIEFPDGIPYGLVPGNHDYPIENYNYYFGPTRFQEKIYYGGSYDTASNENNFTLFSAYNRDFIVINLDFWIDSNIGINDKMLWADSLLGVYKNRGAIIVSHDLIIPSSDNGGEVPDLNVFGEFLYNSLKHNSNLFLAFTGHRYGEELFTAKYQGRDTYFMLANYQRVPNEGFSHGTGGWLRHLYFNIDSNYVQINTYSPVLDSLQLDEDSNYNLPINFDLHTNQTLANVSLDEDFTDTVEIKLDSIFRFIGGEINYSSFINDTSCINTLISAENILNIYSVEPNTYGVYNITINATNNFNDSIFDSFEVEISPINDPPFFLMESFSYETNLTAGVDISLLAHDVDSDYYFSLEGAPPWLDIQGSRMFGQPDKDSVYVFIVSVSDSLNVASEDYTINVVDLLLSKDEEIKIPAVYALKQNYPNPFNPNTQISYALPKETMVTISIYDMVGRNVKTLVNQTQSPGYYTTRWNATNDYGYSLSAGVYIYTINAGTYNKMKKMVVLK